MSKKDKKRKWWQLQLGSWSDLKKGTEIGSGKRNRAIANVASKATRGKSEKPSEWLRQRGQVKSDEWITQRVQRFRTRVVVITGLLEVAWFFIAAASGVPTFGFVIGAVVIALASWRMYKWVIRKVMEGRGER